MTETKNKISELVTLFLKGRQPIGKQGILSVETQIRAWKKANRKMKWGISSEAFSNIGTGPPLHAREKEEGFIGPVLFYGFGDDGRGHSDAVLSGKLAWEFARKRKKKQTWQCEYIDFDKPDMIRLRPEAPPRPKGFYLAWIRTGERLLKQTVSEFRKGLATDTGFGPEGIQFLAITHIHFQNLMNERKIPFMAFADYDVAPYGFSDFFDAVQMFCSLGILGLGIGNVDRKYPFFGIPTLRFEDP